MVSVWKLHEFWSGLLMQAGPGRNLRFGGHLKSENHETVFFKLNQGFFRFSMMLSLLRQCRSHLINSLLLWYINIILSSQMATRYTRIFDAAWKLTLVVVWRGGYASRRLGPAVDLEASRITSGTFQLLVMHSQHMFCSKHMFFSKTRVNASWACAWSFGSRSRIK